ncbi:CHASE2 domain-containing protein [Argonema antarcticum]|uniref:CHASE2 domain-containing protein n=1 Tax=Argonema antarcticum TaxID=2942763 RepID=UPI0020132338|nr:CHASE2 domain-containing protein [Argonema antarcticum]MCL1471933.1 CHASE2 domain-containing protein [Argonema antarcticum A004/B2]
MSNINEESFGVNYCINPECDRRENPDNLKQCQSCGTSLFVNDRYRLIKPLRDLNETGNAEIFEVQDWGVGEEDWQIPKVLKINRNSGMVHLFEREARVLMTLRHPGIPRVSVKGYFTISYGKRGKQLHCLVMEKIEGHNLEQWLERNGKITENLAINWLKELAIILGIIHKREIFHRDIKPSNIMLRPDGQLALIDFGTVGEITPVDIDRLSEHNVTIVFSQGYTAPEQHQGQAVPQSDFFALGRTFVHLLTSKNPNKFRTNAKGRLIWRDEATNISKWFAELIDDLMATLPKNRPQNTQVILERLKSRQTKPKVRFRWRDLPKVLLASVLVTSAVMGIRWFGILQSSELQAYDRLMRSRPPERLDSRILMVVANEKDIAKYGHPLPDAILAQLLDKLQQYQPIVIGLDLYRDRPVPPGYDKFVAHLKKNNRLIAICKFAADKESIAPPPKSTIERLGFVNLLYDIDGINTVRRYLLSRYPDAKEGFQDCNTGHSFSFQLAYRYLDEKNIQTKVTSEQDWVFEKPEYNIVFKSLESRAGGYQNIDARGNQVLLNYRSSSEVAKQVTVTDILSDRVNSSLIEDKIILIGTIADSVKDNHNTPLGIMPGLFVHAHMVSQILSTVLDKRPLLWWLPQWGDAILVLICSLIGGIIVWYWRYSPLLIIWLALTIFIAILYVFYFALFIQGAWLPLIPSILAWVVTGVSGIAYTSFQTRQSK